MSGRLRLHSQVDETPDWDVVHLIYHYFMKTQKSNKVNFFSKTKSVGLALALLVITFPSVGEVTTSKVDIPVLGSKCNDRVKAVRSVTRHLTSARPCAGFFRFEKTQIF